MAKIKKYKSGEKRPDWYEEMHNLELAMARYDAELFFNGTPEDKQKVLERHIQWMFIGLGIVDPDIEVVRHPLMNESVKMSHSKES